MEPVKKKGETGATSRLSILEPTSAVRRSGTQTRTPNYVLTCGEPSHDHDLIVRPTESDEEREAAFRLRHAAYCGEGKDLPEQPDSLETDAYDADAVLIVAWLDGKPVGTVRITFQRDCRFLLETFEKDGQPIVRLPDDVPRITTAEPSRMVVSHENLSSCVYSPCVSHALFHRAYFTSRALGMTHWVFEANAKNLRAIRRLGWQITPIGEPLDHHGQRFDAFWIPLQPSYFSWAITQP